MELAALGTWQTQDPTTLTQTWALSRGGSAEANTVQAAQNSNQLCEKNKMLLSSGEQGRFNL